MTSDHAAWTYVVNMLEKIVDTTPPATGKGAGAVSRGQLAAVQDIFDRITDTAILVPYLTKYDMSVIGKVLIELGENSGVRARSVRHE